MGQQQLRAGDLGAALFRGRFVRATLRDAETSLTSDDTAFAVEELSHIISERCPDATAWDLDPYRNVIHVRFGQDTLTLEPDKLDPYDAPVRAAIQALRRTYPLSA